MKPQRVLILCYYFPPTPSAGSIRVGGLAKHLPRFGWQPTIVTPLRTNRETHTTDIIETRDADIGATIKRLLGINPSSALKDEVSPRPSVPITGPGPVARIIEAVKGVLAYPDTNRGWISIAAKAAAGATRTQSFDALLTTSPPPSVHLAGRKTKQRFSIPWVADLRDLWSGDYFSAAPSWRQAMDRRLEIRTLKHADALVTVSPPLQEELKELHPNVPTHTILNGYDPDLVNRGANLERDFVLTYTGTLHQGRRDPGLLFSAVQRLLDDEKIDRQRIRIRLLTRQEPWLQNMVEGYQLGDVVELLPWHESGTMRTMQQESQVLLLFHWGGERERGVYTAKVFDYLAARRPILILGGSKGVLTQLMQDTAAGVHAMDVDHVRAQLLEWWREFEHGGAVGWRGDKDTIERYSHLRMAQQFAAVLDQVSGHQHPERRGRKPITAANRE